jgi:hypothetical protein
LSLYIRAVESGDYELASKYFIEKKRDQELNGLKNSELVALKNITSLLKQTLANPGSYSDDKAGFTIRKPLLVDFEKYPNGIWKIVEI